MAAHQVAYDRNRSAVDMCECVGIHHVADCRGIVSSLARGAPVTAVDLDFVRCMTMVNVAVMVQTWIGVSLLCNALANWNKGKKDSLLVRLARSYLEDNRRSTV